MDKGKRFNDGKTRYDLLEPYAIEQLAKVFTEGAKKYDEWNWMRGMKWSKMLASLKRHIAAYEAGEDFDKETGQYHMAHAAWNAMGLVSYYKYYPQGDDRRHPYITAPKIGLDIDGVLADWVGAYKEKYGYSEDHQFDSWCLHFKILDQCRHEIGDEFYANLKPLITPKELPFEPHCYITSRNIKQQTTEDWLYSHGFPCKPVVTVSLGQSKVEAAKDQGIDVFVDDVYGNFVELNKGGVCCYLYDQPYNRRFDVGYKRLFHLKDLI